MEKQSFYILNTQYLYEVEETKILKLRVRLEITDPVKEQKSNKTCTVICNDSSRYISL